MLKSLVDGGTVQSAADATGSQQRHQQGGFGVALAVSVGQHGRGRKIVGGVVTERDSVPDEVVDGTDPLLFRESGPALPVDGSGDSRIAEIQQGGGFEVTVLHPGEPTDIDSPIAEKSGRSCLGALQHNDFQEVGNH